MPTPTPTLGYGQRGEAPINSVNQWMRAQPWYAQLITSFGQNPANVHLNDAQKQQVIRAAQAHGVVVDEGHNGQEVDDSGNFQAKSHALRNTLIVAGIAGAALLTAGAAGAFAGAAAPAAGALPAGVTLEGTAAGLGGASTAVGAGAAGAGAAGAGVAGIEGGAYGLGSAALAGLGTGAMGAGGAAAAGGVGAGLASGLGTEAGLGTNFMGGPTTISSVVGGIGGGRAPLTYADILKGVVPTAGNLVGGLIQANAAGKASDAQQKYLEEALAYQKESDAYNRQRQATLDAQEVQRYSGYQGRIAPFIANGTSSNDRMAALLGLPARAPGAGGSSGPPPNQRVATDPATQAAIRAELRADNSSDDPAAWDEYLASHGDSATKNWDYWKHRIDTGDGVGKGYAGGTTAPPTASAPPPSAASVQMRAPDGSVKSVPADQVAHFQQLGATVLGAAA